MKAVWYFLRNTHFKRVTIGNLCSAFLDHAKQDHGHNLVERLFHQDSGLNSGQSAFNAVTLNGNLGRQILHLAFIPLYDSDDRHANKHESKDAAKKDGE